MAAFVSAAALLAPLAGATAGSPGGFDPIAAYGERVVFDVFRDGDRIGTHEVRFRRHADGLSVDVDFSAAIRMLGITVYRFAYSSEAMWRDGRLSRLQARIDDDGAPHGIEAVVANGRTVVTGPGGSARRSGVMFPSNHWHPAVVGETAVINTLTGDIAEVRIIRGGAETVETARGPVDAVRYSYQGDVHDTSAWYDSEGRWVKLSFTDASGSEIEYRCIACGAGGEG